MHRAFAPLAAVALAAVLAARAESPAAFGRRCIPACRVASRSNISDILTRRAFAPADRGFDSGALGATLGFQHGLPGLGTAGGQVRPGDQPSRRPQSPFDPRGVFRAGIELVHVTATVTDQNGRLINGLGRADFEILENNELQRVTHFSRERVPLSLGLVLDVSDSMYGPRMDDARAALDRFLIDLLEPTDEAFLLVFNHRPTVAATWTRVPRQLSARLNTLRPFGGTAIYDAMLAALPLFDVRAHQRSAVVLISDGADMASDNNVRQVRAQFRRTGPFVYAIAIDAKTSLPINDRVNPYALREMTDESGGYTEVVHDSSELTPATQRIADELNHQYTLGYTPTRPPDGRYRSIRVRVTNPDHIVRARRGYVATTPANQF